MPSLLEGASSSLLPCLEGGSSAPARALQWVAALGAPLILTRLRAGTPEARAARASDGRHLRVRVRVRVGVRVTVTVRDGVGVGIRSRARARAMTRAASSAVAPSVSGLRYAGTLARCA